MALVNSSQILNLSFLISVRVRLEVVSVSKVVKIVENMCKEFKVVLCT